MTDKIKLIIDDRERAVLIHSKDLNEIIWEKKRICIGDYIVVKNNIPIAIFERKTYEDFAASLKDGRHQNKDNLYRARDKYNCRIYYIIEGPLLPKPNETFARFPYWVIESAIDHLIVRDNFSVIYTRDTLHTALRLVRFVKSMINLDHKTPIALINASDNTAQNPDIAPIPSPNPPLDPPSANALTDPPDNMLTTASANALTTESANARTITSTDTPTSQPTRASRKKKSNSPIESSANSPTNPSANPPTGSSVKLQTVPSADPPTELSASLPTDPPTIHGKKIGGGKDEIDDMLTTKKEINDMDVVREMWSNIKGISVINADIFIAKFTLLDLLSGKVSKAELESICYPNGRKLSSALVDRLQHIDKKTEVNMLATVPGISKKAAEELLTGFRLKSLLSYSPDALSIHTINDKKLGKVKADRIQKYFSYK